MATAVRNSLDMLEVDLPQASRMASLYPATFLGLERELGRIEPGYRADLVLVDEGINVLETWIGAPPVLQTFVRCLTRMTQRTAG